MSPAWLSVSRLARLAPGKKCVDVVINIFLQQSVLLLSSSLIVILEIQTLPVDRGAREHCRRRIHNIVFSMMVHRSLLLCHVGIYFSIITTTTAFQLRRTNNNYNYATINTRKVTIQSSSLTRSSHPLHQPKKLYVSSSSPTEVSAMDSTTIQHHDDPTNTVDLKITDFSSSPDNDNNNNALPPVILLHGLLGNKRNFATLGSSLDKQLQTKRRILAVDLRNHGENTHDWRDTMTYEEMAQDVLAKMNSLGIPNAVLVGHSMGGKVAMACALLEPGRVQGLVILDIAPVTYTLQDPNWKAVQDIIKSIATISLKDCATKRDVDMALRPTIEDPALRAFVLTNLEIQKDKQVCWKINMEAIQSQIDTLAGFVSHDNDDVDDKKEKQQTPPQYPGDAFLIHGGSSKFVRHSYMETIAQYFPNHMLTTIRGAGHWVHAEAPDDTLALLKRFLDR